MGNTRIFFNLVLLKALIWNLQEEQVVCAEKRPCLVPTLGTCKQGVVPLAIKQG